jgi:hypothetical protein
MPHPIWRLGLPKQVESATDTESSSVRGISNSTTTRTEGQAGPAGASWRLAIIPGICPCGGGADLTTMSNVGWLRQQI